MATSDIEIAWLAGLLEGEGSFMMCNNRGGGKTYRYPKIVVGMTDRDIIERVAAIFGTSVYNLPDYTYPQYQKPRKPAYRAAVQGTKAAELMKALYPWLGARRRAKVDEVFLEYDAIEPTEVRRRESCLAAAAKRKQRPGGWFGLRGTGKGEKNATR